MASKEVGARVRAARIHAGYNRRPDLTAQLRLPRFGAKLLGQVERGERPLYQHEAEEIARVLSVDAGSFFADGGRSDLGEVLVLLREAREEREAIEELIASQDRNLKEQTALLAEIREGVKVLASLQRVVERFADEGRPLPGALPGESDAAEWSGSERRRTERRHSA